MSLEDWTGDAFVTLGNGLRKYKSDNPNDLLTTGVRLLDAGFMGIAKDDLLLIGAETGCGKTELASMIAKANAKKGKHIHMFVLEESEGSIERRTMFREKARKYFDDPARLPTGGQVTFKQWRYGKFDKHMAKYNMEEEFKYADNVHIYYKKQDFTADRLIQMCLGIAGKTDLIILDHIHYVDIEDQNENRGMKHIMATARDLVLRLKIPMVIIAHLRKKDNKVKKLVPDIDDFHGTSDLTKIATKCVTLGPGEQFTPGRFSTYFRMCKDRDDGTLRRYVGQCIFNTAMGAYENKFKIGIANGSSFEELAEENQPWWWKNQ